MNTESSEREYLRRQIYTKAIHFDRELLFDFRELLTDAHCAEIAGRLIWQMIKPLNPEILIGPGYGSTPILFSTAIAALRDGVKLKTLLVRDNRKNYHRGRWIEGGRPQKGSRAVIIDDFMKMGSAVKLVDRALEAEKVEVNILACAVFFDMWEPLGSRQISTGRFPVLALYKRHDIGMSRDCFDAKPPEMKGSHPPFVGKPLWWRMDLNQPSDYFFKSSPVIADGAVFVADNLSRVWRHNLANGAIEWKYESLARPMKGIVQLLQYHEGNLVFGCYDGTVTKLDAKTGEIIWRVRQDSSIHSTPVIDEKNGRVFINTEQWNAGKPFGHLTALDWKSGRVIWTQPHAYWPPGTPVLSDSQGIVIATCNDESVIAAEAATGKILWRGKTRGLSRGQGLVHGDLVYFATEQGYLHCFEILGGRERWSIHFGSGHSHNFLRAIGGAVCVLDAGWKIHFFALETGELRWTAILRSQGCWRPVNYGKYEVVMSVNGELAVFDGSRELKVREDHMGGVFGQPPGIGEGHLALASNDHGLRVFKINSFYANS